MFCPHCGKEVAEGQVFCQHCGSRIVEVREGTISAGGREKTPWENRENTGYFGGLFRTVKGVLFSPTQFFRTMPVTGGLTDPLLFALIIGMIGLMFSYLWDILLHDSLQNFMTPEMRAATGRAAMPGGSPVFAAIITPFLLILWLFVVSGMLHLFLLLVRGAKAGFEATFRVVGYSVSLFLFLVIPFCGMFITALWAMMAVIIGLREAHETTGGKAAFAVLFPVIFCCGMITVLMVLFMGAIAASFGSLMHMGN
jgi:hypothetical protein